jgi:hypothetical protein
VQRNNQESTLKRARLGRTCIAKHTDSQLSNVKMCSDFVYHPSQFFHRRKTFSLAGFRQSGVA